MDTKSSKADRFTLGDTVGYTTQRWFHEAMRQCSEHLNDNYLDIMSLVPQYSYGSIEAMRITKDGDTFYDIIDMFTHEVEKDVPLGRVRETPKPTQKNKTDTI